MQRVRQLITELRLKPLRIGPIIALAPADYDALAARNKTRGRPRRPSRA